MAEKANCKSFFALEYISYDEYQFMKCEISGSYGGEYEV
jgi:hypothetical protein